MLSKVFTRRVVLASACLMAGLGLSLKASAQEQGQKQKSEKVVDTSTIYEVVDEMPVFENGMSDLMKYLATNIKYPKSAQKANASGRAVVSFIVERDGSIKDPEIQRSTNNKDLDREALRVVSKMPKWKPGKSQGLPVRTRFSLPIVFKLQ